MLSGLSARLRSLSRSIRRRADVESEMTEEFRSHMELRAADLVRSGLSPADATRQARLEFGSTERYKDEARESRGLGRIDALRVSWLDFKLGFRMLVKYPGLTLVGGLAIAFAIWMGAATFELMTQVMRPTLPLDEGHRIVGIRTWDAKANREELRIAHDFLTWRAELTSVEDLGAFRTVQRNLITGEGVGEPIDVAEISASALRLTRVPPLLGRVFVDADEAVGAPPVVIIGHELWRRRFAGDSAIIGQSVRLGRSPTAIVGVMPAGFAFPISHDFWVPLRMVTSDYERRAGPSIRIVGRLAPGASLAEAQAELAAIGARTTADFPSTHQHLRPEVLPYANSIFQLSPFEQAALLSVNVPMLLLLVLICGNVALLMFARAATRETEMVVRTALGATRARIIMQLFAEALVLGTVAAVIGLAAAGHGLDWVLRSAEADMNEGRKLPFWLAGSLSPTTLLYAAVLTVLGAIIAGVVPALKVTRGMGKRLQRASAGGGGMQFGGIWTAVIIIQVAVTVAFPAIVYFARRDGVQIRAITVGFPAEEYLAVRLEMDRDPPPGAPGDTSRAAFLERYRSTYKELEQRLSADASVAGVTFADRLPRMYHPHRLIEMDAGGVAPLHPDWPEGHRVSSAHVDPDFFAVLGAPILAGRGFHAGDLASNAVPVIVNQSFVRRVLGDRNPIGRRIRHVLFEEGETSPPVAERGPWYEIVGVVRDMGMAEATDPKVAGIYHPATPSGAYPAQVAIHVKGDPETFVPRLRTMATEVDPTLRLYDVERLDQVNRASLQTIAFWVQLFAGVSAVALVLSLAGIYAVMSFTVAKRTREIGIRVALGASQPRVIAAVFVRPITQVAMGIVAGASLIAGLLAAGKGKAISPEEGAIIAGYALFMMAVCMVACIVPTRRALRVQPTEALRADG